MPDGASAVQDQSGVNPSVISLPSGLGLIEGLGPFIEPQINTGSASYGVKIALTLGVCGHQPKFALQYNSGFGNSPFGIGWRLPIPSIQRQPDKGQPAYEEGDVFIYSNGEELVPLADGAWLCENKSVFMRFKRVGVGWEIRDKSGRTYGLGQYFNEGNPIRTSRGGQDGTTGLHQTFKWYLNTFEDTNGNKIEYFYTPFSDFLGQLYLSDIRYNVSGWAHFVAGIYLGGKSGSLLTSREYDPRWLGFTGEYIKNMDHIFKILYLRNNHLDNLPGGGIMATPFKAGNIQKMSPQEALASAAIATIKQKCLWRREEIAECTTCLWKHFCQGGCAVGIYRLKGSFHAVDGLFALRKKFYPQFILAEAHKRAPVNV